MSTAAVPSRPPVAVTQAPPTNKSDYLRMLSEYAKGTHRMLPFTSGAAAPPLSSSHRPPQAPPSQQQQHQQLFSGVVPGTQAHHHHHMQHPPAQIPSGSLDTVVLEHLSFLGKRKASFHPPAGGEDSHRLCCNCGITNTPFWRKDRHSGLPLCNACGLYASKNDHPRPSRLWHEGQQIPVEGEGDSGGGVGGGVGGGGTA